MAEKAFILIPRRKDKAMKFGKAKARARACARALAKGRRVRGFAPAAAHTMSLEFKFWVAHIIGVGSPPPRVCNPLPRVTPHGKESSETWIIDLRDRMPIVDDRPREHAGEIGKIDDAAAKAEVATMRAAVYGKDKI
jgi:hypothetical protein